MENSKMKITIDLPNTISGPLKRTAEGFGIRFERAVEIAVGDYVAALDSQFVLFGDSVTPHAAAFDEQFSEGHEDGWEIESSCEASKSNWLVWLMEHSEYFQGKR
jgi:hypothetical protein